jgi:hypothetical protein
MGGTISFSKQKKQKKKNRKTEENKAEYLTFVQG